MGGFPESTFTIGGDPSAIRGSAGTWSTFATDAAAASGDVRGLDTSEFHGDEADTYRSRTNQDLPPHLDTTSTAWTVVSTALSGYADTLEDIQGQLRTLRSTAYDQWQQVNSAQSSYDSAASADAAHTSSRQDAAEKLKPGEKLPTDTYHPQTGSAHSALTGAQSAFQHTVDAANTLRSRHDTALAHCGSEIDRAKHLRFAEPPGFWGKLTQSVGDWIKDHADVLTSLSSVLKMVSGIAGLLSLIPVLAPIMGPIALVSGAAALAIDVTLKLVTGEGSWTDIGIDAALMVLPGVGKLAKGAVMATRTGQRLNTVAKTGLVLLKDSKGGKALAALGNTKVGQLAKLPGKGLNWANDKIAVGLRKVPGVNKLPGVKWHPDTPFDDPGFPKLAKKQNALPKNKQHLLDYNPDLPGIHPGATPRVADNGNGWNWQKATATHKDSGLTRIMGPAQHHPDGYVRFHDGNGQPVGLDGKPNVPQSQVPAGTSQKQANAAHTHIDRDQSSGQYPVPPGWPS
jgi:hypothetical protein